MSIDLIHINSDANLTEKQNLFMMINQLVKYFNVLNLQFRFLMYLS